MTSTLTSHFGQRTKIPSVFREPSGTAAPTAMVLGDLRIDELAAQRLEAFVRAFLIRPRTHYANLKSNT
jgi:hypothetical protein